MAARLLFLTLAADATAARRRAAAAGPWRLLATALAASGLLVAEIWFAARLAHRLVELGPPTRLLATAALHRLEELLVRVAGAVATASALSLALPVIRSLETEPFRAAVPEPAAHRALAAWWRVSAASGWVAVLALPPLAVWRLALGGAAELARLMVAAPLALAAACALGTAVAVLLAAGLPARLVAPAAWTGSTAAVVTAVFWLRAIHPERLASAADPAALLAALASLGAAAAPATAPLRHPLLAALALAAGLVLLVGVWRAAGRLAGEHLAEAPLQRGASPLWRAADAVLLLRPPGAPVAARLRLLARDAVQASQLLYLLGLGAVYLENLRAVPLGEPLARELAAVVNLGMAALLAAALALRFAYPAWVLEGPAGWLWESVPLSTRTLTVAYAGAAAVAPLLLAVGLWTGATLVLGPTSVGRCGWWLVPALALELTLLGVAVGPRPAGREERWLQVALGGGGLAFLALAVTLSGWSVAAAAASVVREIFPGWRPPPWLATPWVPVAVGAVLAAVVVLSRGERPPPDFSGGG